VTRFLLPADFLERHGTESPRWQREESLRYTRRLARAHYENFPVVSLLLPRRLHQDFYNVYSFCRWADDLGDEIGDPRRSLKLLAWWRHELHRMYEGDRRHPVYVALAETVEKHAIPKQPFLDLIHAFEQDQRVTRYPRYEEVLDYCRYSANPVGRLVLHLCGYTDEARIGYSDHTCTALQLANFWQDVARDYRIGRVYLPHDVMGAHGYSAQALEADLGRGQASAAFRDTLRDLVERTQGLFVKGLPLVDQVDRRLAVDLELFSRGGMAVLERIRRQNYDTIRLRPKLRRRDRFALILGALKRGLVRRPRVAREAEHAFR
jgi:squalene synthase HpnC